MSVNPIAVAIPVFMVLIVIEWLVANRKRLRVYRFADAITDLSCGVSSQITGVFLHAALVAPYWWVYDNFRLLTLDATWWGTHVIALFVLDFAYYWWHRWTHEMNLGWMTHVVHHQSEEYNLAVALRQSITSPISIWPFYIPLALLGIHPLVYVGHSALNTLYQFWIHTETIGKLGPIGWVFNTPSHHQSTTSTLPISTRTTLASSSSGTECSEPSNRKRRSPSTAPSNRSLRTTSSGPTSGTRCCCSKLPSSDEPSGQGHGLAGTPRLAACGLARTPNRPPLRARSNEYDPAVSKKTALYGFGLAHLCWSGRVSLVRRNRDLGRLGHRWTS